MADFPPTDCFRALFQYPASARRGGIGVTTAATLATLAALGAGALAWYSMNRAVDNEDASLVESAVRRDFELDIVESGEIESSGNVEVRCEVESNNTAGTAILRLVPEGTAVKEGDFLIELDSSALEKERIQQQIIVNTSESLMIQAQNVYETAVIARREYLEGTFEQEKQLIESEVFVAEENLRRAMEYLQYSRRLLEKGYIKELELEADAFAVEKSKKELESARTKLRVLEQFTKPKMLKQLESDIETAKAKWAAEQSSYELEVRKLDDIKDQIGKCIIQAPGDGIVTYAHRRDRRGDSDFVVEEGAVVRERQVLVRLPDPGKMQVGIEVNEAVVDMVQEGMRASIRPVGRDDLVLPGTVVNVNEYSEPTSRWEGNVKNYAATIRIDEPRDSLRSGMTAEVTVHCQSTPDTLQVPVQAVYAHGPRLNYCAVKTTQGWDMRAVQIGPTNDRFVVIRDGLQEGELVSLDPRRHVDTATLPALRPDEMQQAIRPGPRHETASQDVAATAPEPKARPSTPPAGGPGMFARLDADKDGGLTEAELPSAMRPFFATVDANQDERIDPQELRAAMQRFQAGRGSQTARADDAQGAGQ